MTEASLNRLCINSIRVLAVDMIQQAKSGHPGLPLGAAPMSYVLWHKHLRHAPSQPRWPDRDRFVLSPGHGSALLYSLLHLTGYALPLEELKAFRQWGSKTPGHPESTHCPGGEATTGPLGQGAANAVGMAMAERMLAHRFNRPGFELFNHYTFALVGDGDLMEGVSAEASSLAGHLRLGKLIYLYDSNDVTLDGPTSIAFSTEDVAKRYEAYGWHVQVVQDGNEDLDAIDAAIAAAKAETTRPSLIVVKTTIGWGSPKSGTNAAHGSPLGEAGLAQTKKVLGFDPDKHFEVPQAAIDHLRAGTERGEQAARAWNDLFEAYAKAHPELAEECRQALAGELPVGWDSALPSFSADEAIATRIACGKVINAFADRVPSFVGGDADIGSSTKTEIKGAGWFDGQSGQGRNIHFGVREHAMAAIANGMLYHGGVRPMVSTFLAFVDYMRPAVRVAALSKLPTIFVFSHDSLAVGEDGPTHQPVEQLASLRIMPNMTVVRPADATETTEAWRVALQHSRGPIALITTRQDLPVIDRSRYGSAKGLAKGAYVLADPKDAPIQAILLATGSEVSLALQAHERLARQGIGTRVVSMPSWELFAAQPLEYRNEVLPPAVRARVAVEAGVSFGWERWVGDHGLIVGCDRFGASAPGDIVLERFGFSADVVVQAVRSLIDDHASAPFVAGFVGDQP